MTVNSTVAQWCAVSVVPAMRVLLLCFLMLVVLCAPLRAEVLDRVVASVDDIALTLSELEANYRSMKDRHPNITHEEVINSMINRVLLLRAAQKMKLEALTDDVLLKEYVEIKIRSLVVIKEETVMQYYSENQADFDGRLYAAVRDDIEAYLAERETNRRLKEHLSELREQSDISIRLGQ
jgi:hypothetical protein